MSRLVEGLKLPDNTRVWTVPSPEHAPPDHLLQVLGALEDHLKGGPLVVLTDGRAAGDYIGTLAGHGPGTHHATHASPVGLAQLAVEHRALAAARAGRAVRVVRVVDAFGGHEHDLLDAILDDILHGRSPHPRRVQPIHVADARAALAALLSRPAPSPPQVELVAGPQPVHTNHIAAHIAALLQRPAPSRSLRTPTQSTRVCPSHPASGPGWKARVAEVLEEQGHSVAPQASDQDVVPAIHPRLQPDRALQGRLFDIVGRRWLSNSGPNARHFEARIAERTGARHVVAVGSGSAALLVAAQALGCTGAAVVPSFTFLATASAVVHCGMEPVFCDIDPRTWTLDTTHLARILDERDDISLILPVTTFGVPPDLTEVNRLAHSAGARVLHDACHSFGSALDGTPVLGLPGLHTLSMHATKILSAVEGGLVCTHDDTLADEVRKRANYGFTKGDRLDSLPAFNFHFDELRAEVAHHSLDHADAALALRAAHAQRLRAAAAGLQVQHIPPNVQTGFQEVGVCIPAGSDITHALQKLQARGVQGRRYFHPPLHTMARFAAGPLEHTDALSRRILCMPIHPWMPEAHVARVEAALRALALEAAG